MLNSIESLNGAQPSQNDILDSLAGEKVAVAFKTTDAIAIVFESGSALRIKLRSSDGLTIYASKATAVLVRDLYERAVREAARVSMLSRLQNTLAASGGRVREEDKE